MRNYKISLIILLLVTGVFAVLFLINPELDLKFTGLFYNNESGFYLKDKIIPSFLYLLVKIITGVLIVSLIGFIIYVLIKPNKFPKQFRIYAIYLLLSLAIGPGLMVNTVFKDNWGRARPSQVTEFGGSKQFSPPILMTDQCERNCSFVSGHASIGYYIFAFYFLALATRKKYANVLLYSGVAGGLLFGFMRIIQGAHFLSDVIFSGIVVFITCWLLYELLINKFKPIKD